MLALWKRTDTRSFESCKLMAGVLNSSSHDGDVSCSLRFVIHLYKVSPVSRCKNFAVTTGRTPSLRPAHERMLSCSRTVANDASRATACCSQAEPTTADN